MPAPKNTFLLRFDDEVDLMMKVKALAAQENRSLNNAHLHIIDEFFKARPDFKVYFPKTYLPVVTIKGKKLNAPKQKKQKFIPTKAFEQAPNEHNEFI